MAGRKEGVTYEDVVRRLKDRDYSPVYYLMGEESYYIDRISDYIISTVLKEEERDFNQTILYGMDVNMRDVINTAKRYPMMAEHQVVVIREAQHLNNIEELSSYLKNPQPSTILVFCHKNGLLDRRKKVAAEIQKTGVLFESKKLYDSQLPVFISTYLKRKDVTIDADAALILSNYVGSDLNRLAGELDKLILALSAQGALRVTASLIETHIGVSKDFNTFELVNALVERQVYKANQIVKYFNSNPKANPIQRTLPVLFNFFSNLMLAYYAPQKTEEGIAAWLEQPVWQVRRNVLPAMNKYSGVKVMQIISELRKTDAKSKGVDNPNTPSSELLRELIFFILH